MWRIDIYDILSLFSLEREIRMKTRMKELRVRYDLTQEDLAKKIGVRRETILFIEKGKYNPSLNWRMILRKLCRRQLMNYLCSRMMKDEKNWNNTHHYFRITFSFRKFHWRALADDREHI